MSMAPQERRGSMAPPPADSDARRVSMAPQERRGSTASRSDSNPTARRDPGARRPSDAGTLRRGSLGGPPPPPKRSAENDRILELKQIADRAAGKRDEDEEVEAGFRAALLEIVFYLLFVVIFAMVTWLSSIQVAYPYSSKITGIVVGDPPYSLRDVYKEDQFWGYLEDTLVPGIFVSRDYNHQQLPESRLGYVLNVDKMIGAVRLEQKRVKKNTNYCQIPPVYELLIDTCYPRIRTEFDVASDPYGHEDQFTPTATGFISSFGGMRFVQDIDNEATPEAVIDILRGLRNSSWIDGQTREVTVIFTVYNPAADLFCNVLIEFQFLHTGGIQTRATYRTISMLRQWLLLTPSRTFFPADLSHKFLFAVELIFLVIVLGMVIAETRQLIRLGWVPYISSVWNMIDFLNLSLFIIFYFYRFFFVTLVSLLNFRPPPDTYSEFRYMSELTYQSQNLTAFNCVLTYMKMFKYLQFSTRLSQLTHTLTEASEDLVGFLFMFLLVFMAYAFSFHMAFGMDVESFRDFTNSFFTLFLIILGDFNFEELRLANDLLGPVLFISYVVIVYLILFNMFLAIIGEAYVRVKEKTSSFEDPFMRNIRAGLYARKQRRLRRIERELYGDDEEHVVTAEDIRAIEADLREILGDAETDSILLRIDDEDDTGEALPPDELSTLMQRIVVSRERLEQEARLQEEADTKRALPEEIEAKDPAFALRVSHAKAQREKLDQVELNQKQLYESIQLSQKAVMLKISALTDTMEAIGSKLSSFKTFSAK